MNEKVLHTLEFDKIITSLVECAGSQAGKRLCKELKPLCDLERIECLEEETEIALSYLERRGEISFAGIPEASDILLRIAVKATLGAGELRRIESLLRVTGQVKKYCELKDEEKPHMLTEKISLLEPLNSIEREINRCIVSDDEIADDASAALKSIRRKIKEKRAKISEKLGEVAKEYAADEKLQDNLVTMRNGRYCVPVKAEFKNKIPGMIHDKSQTGNTFFVEPMAIVSLNNEIRELEGEEQDEIERILMMLSLALVPELENLKYNLSTLVELDAIFARGRLAKRMRAVRPKFNEGHIIELKKARHPLINPKAVVPIDISLGESFNLLIITGPNTGGKTVSLKTIGLLTLMGQSGLHIPALEGSKLGIFKEVYADIGDEQSIEQSLSTFSSHMTNTVNIVDNADEDSLVLFDELGAGTDPAEGAALAMAILDDLNQRSIRTMATTHYSELKAYALTTEGVTNGSCEFDVETLRPTYRLMIGIPGKSNAFAISYKLGMNERILEKAKSLTGKDDRDFDEILSKIDELRLKAEAHEAATKKARNEAETLRNNLAHDRDMLRERKDKEIQKAKEEARDIVASAKEYADKAIRDLNKAGAGVNLREMEENRRALRKKVDSLTDKPKEEKVLTGNHKPTDFRIGDSVHVISMNMDGTIHSLPNKKGECMVNMGILQYRCKITDLLILKDETKLPEKVVRNGAGTIKMAKSFVVSTEINLVGKYPDDAVAELEKYLDDAYLAGLKKVTVIHGRGTGALRAAVQNHLRRYPIVKGYRNGEFGEGDAGVTIVELK